MSNMIYIHINIFIYISSLTFETRASIKNVIANPCYPGSYKRGLGIFKSNFKPLNAGADFFFPSEQCLRQ